MVSFITSPATRFASRLYGPVISLPATRNHTASIIMLHGLGDTGNGWAPVAPELNMPHIKWIFPTAPTRKIAVNYGMEMPGWFDIDALDQSAFESMMNGSHPGFDPEGTTESVSYINSLIEQEVAAGIPPERVLVGGFSQGGHIALKTSLQYAKGKLAGCVALSTWMEPSGIQILEQNFDLPIFYGHGSADPLIPAVIANATLSVLQTKHCNNIEFKMYPGMGHSSCAQEMTDLKNFLLKVLPEKSLTAEDVHNMSARELKEFIVKKGESTIGLLEKKELLDKALSLL